MSIDLSRVDKWLDQIVRLGKHKRSIASTRAIIEKIVPLCGETSHNRAMVHKLCLSIICQEKQMIMVPVCPDYSYENGKYNFKSLSGGVSLLAQKHIDFLDTLVPVIPDPHVMFLLADQEANDPELCRIVGKSQSEFSNLVRCSVDATRDAIAHRGWNAQTMTEVIPDLEASEKMTMQWIASTVRFKTRIYTEMIHRQPMYHRINREFTEEDMLLRTRRTAAQYMVFGAFIARNNFMWCNHTTTNLSWGQQTRHDNDPKAAILHNPISVY